MIKIACNLSRLVRILGIAASLIGLIALSGWIFHVPLLASYCASLKPMAPSSGVLFILLGAMLFSGNSTCKNRMIFFTQLAVIVIITFSSLLIFLFSLHGIRFPIESLGLTIQVTMNEMPVGYMSSLTALCFVLSGISFLCLLLSSEKAIKQSWTGFLIVSLLIAIATILLLGYLYGAPLLYSGKDNPPSLPTSFGLFILSVGLLILSGRRIFQDERYKGKYTSLTLFSIFILFALGIVGGGYFYFKNSEKIYLDTIEDQLRAVGELKTGELIDWRKERLSDASIFYHNGILSQYVQRYFLSPNDREARDHLKYWMRQIQEAYAYDRFFLYDALGVERLSFPETSVEVSDVISHCLFDVIQSGRMGFEDFYLNEHDGRVYLHILVPVSDPRQDDKVIGVFGLRIDPERYLYPYVQQWPTPSRTAETLLVRREGEEIVFLNELRHKKNMAVVLRLPLINTDLPAVKAANGVEGIVKGRDYRGIQVIADVRAVPNSPWFLVSKIDREEVYTPLQKRSREILASVCILLLAAGFGIGMVWRHQRVRFYREKYEAAEALHLSEEKFFKAFRTIPDALVLSRIEDGKILEVNDNWNKIFGYSREEIFGKTSLDLNIFENPSDRQHVITLLQEQGFVHDYELKIRRKSGEFLIATLSAEMIDIQGDSCVLTVIHDISARKQAEEKYKQLADLNQTILDTVNVGLIFTKDRKTQWVNNAIIKMFGYEHEELIGQETLIFYGNKEDYQKVGMEGYTQLSQGITYSHEFSGVRKDGSLFWCYLTGRAIDSQYPYQGSIWVVYDMTDRKRAEEALQKSEEEHRFLLDNTGDFIARFDRNGKMLFGTNASLRFHGYRPDEIINTSAFDRIHPEDWEMVRKALQQISDIDKEVCIEYRLKRKSGEYMWVEGVGSRILNASGEPEIIVVQRDITERKRVEEALATEKQRLAYILEGTNVGTWEWNVETTETIVNERWAEIIGYTLEEISPVSMETWEKFVHPDDFIKSNDLLKKHFNKELEYYSCEARMRHKDGSWIWILDRGKVVTWTEDGKPLIMSGTHQDITEQKRAEVAIRESEEQFRTLFMSLSEGFYTSEAIYDEDGNPCDYRFLEVNPRFEEILGLTHDQIIGKRFKELIPVDTTGWLSNYCEVARTGIPQTYEFHSPIYQRYFETYAYQSFNGQVSVFVRDITERKRIEVALKESEERYRNLVEVSPYGIAVQQEGRLVFVNSAGARIIGAKSPEEILGKPIREIVHPDTMAATMERVRRLLQGETGLFPAENRYLKIDGSEITVEVMASQLIYDGKSAVQVIVNDITKRKQTETALKESEERYRNLIDVSPYGIGVQQEERIVFINPAGARILGASAPEELLGKDVHGFIHPDNIDKSKEKYKRFLQGEADLYPTENRFVKLDGSEITADVVISLLMYGGRPAVQFIFNDITDRKRMEESLRESELLFRSLFESSPNAIMLIDPYDPDVSWPIIDCNEEACHMNGYARKELIGQSIDLLNITPGSKEERSDYVNHLRQEGTVNIETFHRRKNGSIFPIDVTTSFVTIQNRELLLGIDRDITERKKAEEQIRKDLEEKEIMLREIHHRVKNNLAVISSLLNLQAGQIRTKQQALEAFKESRDRVYAMALIHEKLYQSSDFSNIDMKSYLNDLSRQLIRIYHVDSQIQLILNVEDISIDINRAIPCGLIINELITNAFKHAFPKNREGKITVSFKTKNDSLYEFKISDNGVGFPKDFDFENSVSLGLYLARHLTAQLNGTWDVTGNEGTTFTIQLPK